MTAYELRIRDWSSDVCSSDLHGTRRGKSTLVQQQVDSSDCHGSIHRRAGRHLVEHPRCRVHVTVLQKSEVAQGNVGLHVLGIDHQGASLGLPGGVEVAGCGEHHSQQIRSEEHTSELQSLMRISYAVFCLKQKKHNTSLTQYNN